MGSSSVLCTQGDKRVDSASLLAEGGPAGDSGRGRRRIHPCVRESLWLAALVSSAQDKLEAELLSCHLPEVSVTWSGRCGVLDRGAVFCLPGRAPPARRSLLLCDSCWLGAKADPLVAPT